MGGQPKLLPSQDMGRKWGFPFQPHWTQKQNASHSHHAGAEQLLWPLFLQLAGGNNGKASDHMAWTKPAWVSPLIWLLTWPALWVPCWLVLHGGWLLAARGLAWASKLLGLGASATWVTSPCHVPHGLPLAQPTPRAPNVLAEAWCSQAQWDSKRCWGPSAPSVSRSSQRHWAPQSNTWSLAESSPISIFPGIYRSHIFSINI